MRAPAALAWIVVFVLVAPALAVASPDAPATRLDVPPPCPSVQEVEGLGPACRDDDGLWRVFAPDGTSLGRVHGPDPAPSHGGPGLDAATPRDPVCVEDGSDGFAARIIYARAIDDGDHYDTRADDIREMTRKVNGLVHDTAAALGTTADLKVICESGTVKVEHAILPTPTFDATFSTIVRDLRLQGYTDPREKHWIFYDDFGASGFAGFANIQHDDRPDPSNIHNGWDAMYAVTFGGLWERVWLHELGHNLGAVQDSAPHSTDAWHCNDGWDIMCYDDGGPRADYDPTVCPDRQHWDCGSDDYFHPDPAPGSYLADHWNVGHAANRFVQGCMEQADRVTPDAPGLAGPTVSVPIPADCRDRPFALMTLPEGPSHPLWFFRWAHTVTDLDVCFFDGPVELSCHRTPWKTYGGWETGRIPQDATRAEVTLAQGTPTAFSLHAS